MIQSINNLIATPGPGYQATSLTSVTIANTGSITVTTQAGLAYSAGARVRLAYTSDTTKWLEGQVTSYFGTTLVFTADTSNGSGTFASWNINLSGTPGAATAVTVGTTTTGAAGSSAAVTNSGTAYAPVLNFTVPTGPQGAPGSSVNPRGNWLVGTTYAQFDGVTYNNQAWVSLIAGNVGVTPGTDATKWTAVGSASTGACLSSAYLSTGTVACSNGGVVALPFDTNVADVGGVHSTSSNTSKFVIPTGQGGWYFICGGVRWDAVVSPNSGQYVAFAIRKNGTTTYAVESSPTAGVAVVQQANMFLQLADGDYVEFIVNQATGAALNVIASGQQVFGQIFRLM